MLTPAYQRTASTPHHDSRGEGRVERQRECEECEDDQLERDPVQDRLMEQREQDRHPEDRNDRQAGRQDERLGTESVASGHEPRRS